LGANSINDVPVPLLKEILLNHVVNGSVTSSQLTTGYIKTLSTPVASPTSKMSLFVNTAAGVRLNGVASVSTPNILASNGVIHVVDAVITLPTVVTFAVADPNFSTLVSALTTLTPSTDFVTVLSGNGPFTVFAPTDEAFADLPAGVLDALLLPENKALLAQILTYHVVAGKVMAADVTDGDVATVEGSNITLSTLGGVSVNDANVIAADVEASNGVIHAINAVILPPGVDVAALVK
jgi:uncharacterized surface protein with fasciclin (FAS1) repeats